MVNQVEADLLAGIPAAQADAFFRVISVLEERASALGGADEQ
jgi:hypothetical protein